MPPDRSAGWIMAQLNAPLVQWIVQAEAYDRLWDALGTPDARVQHPSAEASGYVSLWCRTEHGEVMVMVGAGGNYIEDMKETEARAKAYTENAMIDHYRHMIDAVTAWLDAIREYNAGAATAALERLKVTTEHWLG